MKTIINVIIMSLLFFDFLYSKENNFEQFYGQFLISLKTHNEELLKELTYFVDEEEKEYFSFDQVFDSTIVDSLLKYDIKRIKKIKRSKKLVEDNPFEILEIPIEVKEIYVIKLKTFYIEDDENIELINYFVFGKYKDSFLFLGSYIEG